MEVTVLAITNKRVRENTPLDWLRRRLTLPFALSLLSFGLTALGPGLESGWAQSAVAGSATTTDLAPFGPNTTPAGQLPLGPGDLVDVTVFNTPELSGRLRIDQQGGIDLPVSGHLVVGGLNALQASTAIEKHLRDGEIMLEPHVSVQIFQFATQTISILGEVRAPGPYPLFGPHTLYGALSLAGGPTANEGSTITITHHSDPDHPQVVQVNSPNFSQIQNTTPIYPGDVIFVSTADLIYVVGDAASPGPIPIAQGRDLTLLKVISLCHGWTATAAPSKATIIRKNSNGTVEVISVDLNGVMKATSPDLLLQASDVLVMPHSAFKKFLLYALPSATGAAFNGAEISVVH